MKISNKDGSKNAKELIMKVVYSVTYSVDDSARSKIRGDITKIFEIKKAANQRLAAVSREDRIRTCDPLVPNQVRYRPALLPDHCNLYSGNNLNLFGGEGEIRTRGTL